MSDSKRLRTLKVLSQWYRQEIKIANGYKHDLDTVIRGRMYITASEPLPCVSILEDINPDRDPRMAGTNDSPAQGKSNEMWALLVQGWVKEEFDYPCDAAYELMADVKKATAKLFEQGTADAGLQIDMGDGDLVRAYYLGGLVNGFQCEPGTVRPTKEPDEKAFFWMRVILKFTERVNDPFRYN